MTATNALDRGRESFRWQRWADTFDQLTAAKQDGSLEKEDLERLAVAACLIGKDQESTDHWTLAHQEWLRLGNAVQAARCAFWLAFGLLNRGEMARGSGWLARARRLVEDGQQECVEQGYLLIPTALQCFEEGDTATAYATFDQAARIGIRFDDPDLGTLARLGRGQALIRLGKTDDGVALLDEAMVSVTSGEVSPLLVGLVYCGVIEARHEIFDLRRAQEWTTALSYWCDAQSELVLYRGQCLVHRAEIMLLHGAWQDALDETRRAYERLSEPPGLPAVGAALYQQGELHRLRGEFVQVEDAYRQAAQWGRSVQPGLALLRLAQGQADAAVAAIHRAVDEAQGRVFRSTLLPAFIEIMVATGEIEVAHTAAEELAQIAAERNAPLLNAISAQATGSVWLAKGDARSALDSLRRAWKIWQDLEVPYESARVRVLIGLTYRELGDEDTAQMEFDAAGWVFRQLVATPELARAEALSRKATAAASSGLTARELEVLRLVAAGKTNRVIATDLFLSEKTVARHLSNIFTKLNLSSRSAATAHAFEHDLL